ncbi:ATP-dependent DNA helicase [Cupriavidus nantongensis]|uniref:ATP-dependent DNA helicase n=1 Tax=Cupriavidus nantongensis TaxID=1796606 RepID=UPI0022487267|nr:AAA family ATPase [Cupriavidus nantongensis]
MGLADADTVQTEIDRLVEQGALLRAAAAYRHKGPGEGVARSREDWVRHLRAAHVLPYRIAAARVDAAIASGELVQAPARYTTHAALKREKAILAIERAGRGTVAPIVEAGVLACKLVDRGLTPGQRAAIEAMVATRHRVVGIEGDAGTGKTYAINQAVSLLRNARAPDGSRYRTVALAPYGNQVKALRDEGLEASTLARFLHRRDRDIGANTVVLLDEAGVVGARQMAQLLGIVEKAQARLVMIGDTKQLAAIEAGKPFAQLQASGMQTARITEIQRQQDPVLRAAVAEVAQGRIRSSLANLRVLEEHRDVETRHRAVVAAYSGLDEVARQSALMIAGTNEARRDLNHRARKALGLEGTGRQYETLSRVDMTKAQRRYAPSYQRGMVVQVERDCPRSGLVAAESYRIKEVLAGNRLMVMGREGKACVFNPRTVPQLAAYHADRSELAVGDLVRVTRTDSVRGLTIGERLRVSHVGEGEVVLVSPEKAGPGGAPQWRMPATAPLHLEHAYASTVHSAQGLTSDRVFVALDTKSRTASMNLYYVAISRARHEARVYTDSLVRLPEAISRRGEKTTAMGVMRERGTATRMPTRQRVSPGDGPIGPMRL